MRRQRWSIALRLALLFSAIAVVILVVIGAYLYRTLATQMLQRDDMDLLNKATVLRHLLAGEESAATLRAAPGRVLSTVYGEGVSLRIEDGPGSLLVQNGVAPRPRGALSPVPLALDPRATDIRELPSGSGRARGVAVMAATADGAPLRVWLARERSERLLVLRRYAADLVGALVAGAAIMTLLAFAIVRHGLRPIRQVTAQTNEINAHRLNNRLPVDAAPVELQGLGVAFNAMLDRIEEGVQRLAVFGADLAHDMRTPLNTLMIETQVALSRSRSVEEYQALMASNLEEYERLARMIENTLFLARAENAQLKLDRGKLDAGAELSRIRDYFEGLAEEAGVALVLEPAGAAVALHAEPILFQRAVGNLISNAIAHTAGGGMVRILATPHHASTMVAVSNTGAGLSPERIDRIFDRYYRGDEARSMDGASAGLGLAIVRAIMLLHEGQVVADCSRAGWTTFALYFPNPGENDS
ncbi:heavy metal sensor histidine kinase [Massilia sp. HP4]|uniref:heavy metal sensor histidine kinase n=1 Tax=Massilia sp. HP4 TaxID=2562316 RepID=UPI0010C0F247|nr:heavy metal sensor histidine kinase [Massilia sp. HP4]